MLNAISIQGRLTADPELRQTANGVSVVSFAIACDRDFSTGGQKVTDFFDVVAWRNTAEFIEKYFRKGNLIILNGSLQTRSWEDKNGNKRKTVEIVANTANFCGNKDDKAPSISVAEPVTEPPEDVDETDLPF